MEKLFKLFGKLKVYFASAAMYALMLNYIMLLATSKQIYGINVKAWIILPLGIGLVLLLGFLDYKLIGKHQITHQNKINDIKSQLGDIQEMLERGGNAEG